jgi:hypothetical protein
MQQQQDHAGSTGQKRGRDQPLGAALSPAAAGSGGIPGAHKRQQSDKRSQAAQQQQQQQQGSPLQLGQQQQLDQQQQTELAVQQQQQRATAATAAAVFDASFKLVALPTAAHPALLQLLTAMRQKKRSLVRNLFPDSSTSSSTDSAGDMARLLGLAQVASALAGLPSSSGGSSSTQMLAPHCLLAAALAAPGNSTGHIGSAAGAAPAGSLSSSSSTFLDVLLASWAAEASMVNSSRAATTAEAGAAAAQQAAAGPAATCRSELAGFVDGMCQLLLDVLCLGCSLQLSTAAVAAGQVSHPPVAAVNSAAAMMGGPAAMKGRMLKLADELLAGTAVLLLQWPAQQKGSAAHSVQVCYWRQLLGSSRMALEQALVLQQQQQQQQLEEGTAAAAVATFEGVYVDVSEQLQDELLRAFAVAKQIA